MKIKLFIVLFFLRCSTVIFCSDHRIFKSSGNFKEECLIKCIPVDDINQFPLNQKETIDGLRWVKFDQMNSYCGVTYRWFDNIGKGRFQFFSKTSGAGSVTSNFVIQNYESSSENKAEKEFFLPKDQILDYTSDGKWLVFLTEEQDLAMIKIEKEKEILFNTYHNLSKIMTGLNYDNCRLIYDQNSKCFGLYYLKKLEKKSNRINLKHPIFKWVAVVSAGLVCVALFVKFSLNFFNHSS